MPAPTMISTRMWLVPWRVGVWVGLGVGLAYQALIQNSQEGLASWV